MFGFVFAFLAAMANATSSVLQRTAGKEEETEQELSPRMILKLIKKPVWLFGILAVFAGFLLQAVALSFGQLASVEPILVLELPATILLAWKFLGESVGKREVGAIVAMTVGLAGLIFFLSPNGGKGGKSVSPWVWAIALAVGFGTVLTMAWYASRTSDDTRRAAMYGAATGAGFGITAGLMKGMTVEARHGILHVFTAWELYLMIVAGGLAMYLLQNAMNAGKLVASQPGFTLVDPVVAILWGVLVFREEVQHGWFLLLALLSFALMVGSVILLSQSEQVSGGDSEKSESEPDGSRPSGRARPRIYYRRYLSRPHSGASQVDSGARK